MLFLLSHSDNSPEHTDAVGHIWKMLIMLALLASAHIWSSLVLSGPVLVPN